jgi:hypothetical protein
MLEHHIFLIDGETLDWNRLREILDARVSHKFQQQGVEIYLCALTKVFSHASVQGLLPGPLNVGFVDARTANNRQKFSATTPATQGASADDRLRN